MSVSHTQAKRPDSRSNVKVAALLNIGFTIVEFIGGALTNSLAILADALHDLGDSMVLVSSWKIEAAARRKPDWKRSFGYRRLSLLAAFLNAVVLLGGSVIIIFQVIGRLVNPQPVHATGIIGLAIIGISANAIGSLKLRRGESLNEKVLSWHLLEDVLGWTGILIGGIVMHYTGFYRLDPLLTIGLTAFVLWGVWRNSKELFNVFLEGVPSNMSLEKLTGDLKRIGGVVTVCDIHVWSLDGTKNLCAVRVIVERGAMKQYTSLQRAVRETLKNHRIFHSTIELQEKQGHTEEHEQAFLNH